MGREIENYILKQISTDIFQYKDHCLRANNWNIIIIVIIIIIIVIIIITIN